MAELAQKEIVANTGLIAHGRGEAFDYLLGERTTPEAELAERVAAACLLEARNPVISINGNTAALCASEVIALAGQIPARMEVNLFHRSERRIRAVCDYMESMGAATVLGREPDARLEGIASDRGLCCSSGIYGADVILVPLEDGDRAEALVKVGKRVIAIDLNPLSRTAITANISIVDEVTRALPTIRRFAKEMGKNSAERKRLIDTYDNMENLGAVKRRICDRLIHGRQEKA